MPDIKTALSTAISAWEKDESKQIENQQEKTMPKKYFTVTNNVSRETFNYIKNNPNKTAADVASALAKKGFKEGSVVSICAQLAKQGQVSKDTFTKRLVALTHEYSPLKPATQFRTPKKTIKVVKRKAPTTQEQNAGLAAIAPNTISTPAPQTISTPAPLTTTLPELKVPASIVLTRNYDPNAIVNKLSVLQARQLYDLLKQIFGG